MREFQSAAAQAQTSRRAGHISVIFAALVLSQMGMGCASVPRGSSDEDLARFSPGRWLVLQTNVRPNDRGIISALNYQTQKFIPRCTEVLITSLDDKAMGFRTASGEEYSWQFEEAIAEPPLRHLARYFAPRCDERNLSDIDREGIKVGKGKKGMSRWGVYFAMGYPPDNLTPDTNADVWSYWKYRGGVTTTLRFEDGIVTGFGSRSEQKKPTGRD